MELGKEVFELISSLTPIMNVDLLIKDEKNRTLLSWRDDDAGKGWHIPGGVIRLHETIEERIIKTSKLEIGTVVTYQLSSMGVFEIIIPERKIRGHFISLLIKCFLSSSFVPENKNLKIKDAGYLKWHNKCPKNFLKWHECYRNYI